MSTATAAAKKSEPSILPAAAWAEKVKEYKEQEATFVDNLRSTLEFHLGQAEEIKGLLADLGQSIDDSPAPPIVPVKTGKGTRTRRETTIPGAVETLLLQYKDGLSRADLTVKMSSEMGYEIGEGKELAHKFSNNVYTGGIVKLMAEGKVITVGQRPNTVYKHISNSSKIEIEAFKAKSTKAK